LAGERDEEDDVSTVLLVTAAMTAAFCFGYGLGCFHTMKTAKRVIDERLKRIEP
jgi:hypothetical protein